MKTFLTMMTMETAIRDDSNNLLWIHELTVKSEASDMIQHDTLLILKYPCITGCFYCVVLMLDIMSLYLRSFFSFDSTFGSFFIRLVVKKTML